ncbi:type I DNA topoisomerase [Patescibacteria group bacterium]
MSKNLVIVESPAKAKTISRFLGKEYKVLASMGHVRDLPKSEMGIDIDKNFEPSYSVSEDKKKVIKELKDALKTSKELWIATDEDREGEAIGWHLLSALKVNKKKTPVHRIVFHEITDGAIKKAIENPRKIDMNIVDAQQARRVLDRLVGYELSPLLWKKIRYGLSAGRVQSVAVRLVVEREREIEAFKPEEYWKIIADLEKQDSKLKDIEKSFEAELQKYKGKKFQATNEKEVKKVLKDIDKADYKVVKVEHKQVKRSPAPPFITSTLQQEASRKLGFSVKKTMMVAQQLYEGINTGKGEVGLITYMRTDSVNLADSALKSAKKLIETEYGKEYALDKPRKFKGRKGAQEAHEAIRPVSLILRPEHAKNFLNKDQYRLYELIWKRTVACQMAEAVLDRVAADIEPQKNGKSTEYTFRATGQTIKFPGFMTVYMEGRDNEEENKKDGEKLLPKLEEGEEVDLKKMDTNQHFTKPPARYTEATLVKKLESEGIGRPSTYAPTIGTIMTRGYVEKDGRTLAPTDLAMLVTDLLVDHFRDIVSYKFTAEMEGKLDKVEDGDMQWVPMIKEFYDPFHKNIETKSESLKKEALLKERVIGKDPKSGLKVVARHGRFGPFVQLGHYTKEEIDAMEEKPRRASLPKGTYLESIDLETSLKALELPRKLGKNKKGEEIIVTTGRFGPYIKVGTSNVSLPKDMDPYEVKMKDVETVIVEAAKLKKKMQTPILTLDPDPVTKLPILVKEGRFGPYITDGEVNVSVPKDTEPKKVTHKQAVELLEKKRKAPKRNFGRK